MILGCGGGGDRERRDHDDAEEHGTPSGIAHGVLLRERAYVNERRRISSMAAGRGRHCGRYVTVDTPDDVGQPKTAITLPIGRLDAEMTAAAAGRALERGAAFDDLSVTIPAWCLRSANFMASFTIHRDDRTTRLRRLVSVLAFASLVSSVGAFAEELPAIIDDSSQTADLANDRSNWSVITDQSQEPDLGNDQKDWATITDQSQEADLH
jgi:hypothetical protein